MLMYAFLICINHFIQTEETYFHFNVRLKIMIHLKGVNY